MGLFSSTKAPKGQKMKHHRYSRGGESMKAMLRDELREDAGAAAATGPTAAEEAAPAGAADATEIYKRIADWYNSPEGDALRAAWGAYPSSPETLESWSGFVAVTNAYLDHAGPPTAPAAVQFERAVAEEELGSPVMMEREMSGSPVIEEQQAPPTMAEGREAPAFSEGAEAETGVALERVVDQGKLLTNETLRDWVKRWCKGKKKGLPHISTWNTSQVTDMSELFKDQVNFNADIGAWNTSNVTTMGWMFFNASSFNQPLSDWRVDKVTSMEGMFCKASAFNQPLNGWRVDKVESMEHVFHGASAFNQPLNDWRVDNVKRMSSMFQEASAFNQPLNDWRVDNVTNMWAMFYKASAFNQPLNDWRVDNVTDMRDMFAGALAFDQPLNNWTLSCCCNTSGMFEGTNFRNSHPVRKLCCAISYYGSYSPF